MSHKIIQSSEMLAKGTAVRGNDGSIWAVHEFSTGLNAALTGTGTCRHCLWDKAHPVHRHVEPAVTARTIIMDAMEREATADGLGEALQQKASSFGTRLKAARETELEKLLRERIRTVLDAEPFSPYDLEWLSHELVALFRDILVNGLDAKRADGAADWEPIPVDFAKSLFREDEDVSPQGAHRTDAARREGLIDADRERRDGLHQFEHANDSEWRCAVCGYAGRDPRHNVVSVRLR